MQIGKARVNPDDLSSLADPKPLLASAFQGLPKSIIKHVDP